MADAAIMVGDPDLCCPRCHGPLASQDHGQPDAGGFACARCAAHYPIVAGIADFRLYPDPYIDLEADRAKARRLTAAAAGCDFAALLDTYYRMTPEVPADLARRYRDHHLAGIGRGHGLLARLEAYGASPRPGARVLDLGCGTAGFLAAIAQRPERAGPAPGALLGVDIALRWLVVARHRLAEQGLANVRLICACADHLPLADARCDLVVAEHLLEHTVRAGAVLTEVRRVRAPGGAFVARAVNRHALGPEPHVGVWGVGFLPRRLMDPYVRWRKNIPYRHIHPRSFDAWSRLLRAGGHHDLRVTAPRLPAADVAHQPAGRRRLFTTYARLLARVPPLRPLLRRVGPYVDIVGTTQRPPARTDGGAIECPRR